MISKSRLCTVACLILVVFISGCLPGNLPEDTNQNPSVTTEFQITPTFTVQPTRAAIQTVTPQLANQGGNKPFPTATSSSTGEKSILQVKITPVPKDQGSVRADAPCYHATFIKNVTISDGAGFQPNESIMKMWRVQNTGSCEWSAKTVLAFAHGIDFDVPPSLPLGTSVPPGAIIDISIDVKTPARSGTFQGFWKLQNEMGVPIEMLGSPDSEIALKIVVFIPDTPEPGMAFDFTSNFCSAEWTTAQGLMACPSKELAGDEGAVIRSFTPWLENNSQDNEPALLVMPDVSDTGYISAIYPKFKVKEGDRFKTVIGCLRKAFKCRVTFNVNYTEDGIVVKNLLTWEEIFDGKLKSIDLNLDQLKGKTVQFILRVDNSGTSLDDQAFWLWPRITSQNITN